MKTTAFRLWLQNMYMAYKDETAELGLPMSDIASYFNKYKYWLKREFKHSQGESK